MPGDAHEIDPASFGSYRKILRLALPLVLSQMSVMLMQVIDGVFLTYYSKDAIAALGPSGLFFWLICGFFVGLVGYAGTFVAQYVGAQRPQRVGAAVWQAFYLALAGGLLLMAAALPARAFFAFVDHAPAVQADEFTYFRILCYGGIPMLLGAAVSGFFSGRNDNVPLMIASIAGLAANAVLDYAMIFGAWGLPRMGIAGAAWATVIGQCLSLLILLALFFRPRSRQTFYTWRDRPLDLPLLWRLCLYGTPNGVRMIIEIMVWAVFLLLMGRISEDGLAASNIVWRINGMAFFPIIGLSIAIAMLVGQAQGAARPDLSRKVTRRGLVIAEVWMAALALAMVVAPRQLLMPFFSAASEETRQLLPLCIVLLRFVAIYCLIDGLNIVFMAMLAGAGDTRWLLLTSGAMHAGFLGLLVLLVASGLGVMAMWTAATVFICAVCLAWVVRFSSHKWERMRVIEHAPPDLENRASVAR
jgi:MATE family multidrug resistance protein